MSSDSCGIFCGSSSEELATLPGAKPGTAIRVCFEAGQSAQVRLEQLAHSEGLGWYVQKSFCIPAEMLGALIPQLRKADCLVPQAARQAASRRSSSNGDTEPVSIPLFPHLRKG